MTDLKPCPICGRKLSWEDVAGLDDEGYITHYFVDVATILLNCDCGFNMMISADLIDYPMAGWEDRFKERVNKRVNEPKKMCANCKHWKKEIEGWGSCDCNLDNHNEPLYTLFEDFGISVNGEPGNNCDKWESI